MSEAGHVNAVMPPMFPPPEELFPDKWERPKRRGGPSKADKDAEAKFYKPRDTYAATLEQIANLVARLDATSEELRTTRQERNALETERNALLASNEQLDRLAADQAATIVSQEQELSALHSAFERCTDQNVDLNRRLAKTEQRDELAKIVLCQLAYLLDVELRLLDPIPDPGGRQGAHFNSSYGDFRLWFSTDGTVKLRVQPADTTRAILMAPLDEYGVTPDSALRLAGHLALPDGGRLFRRAADELRRPTLDDRLVAHNTQVTSAEDAKALGKIVVRAYGSKSSDDPGDMLGSKARQFLEELSAEHARFYAGGSPSSNLPATSASRRPEVFSLFDPAFDLPGTGDDPSDPLGFQAEERASRQSDSDGPLPHQGRTGSSPE